MLSEMSSGVIDPLDMLVKSFVGALPGLVAGLIILIVGYLLGYVVSFVVLHLLQRLNVDKWVVEETNLSSIIGKFKFSEFFALITRWYIFVLFLAPAANLFQLGGIEGFLLDVAAWVPNLIVAIVIALLGYIGAGYVSEKIRTSSKNDATDMLAKMVSVIILVFTAIISLKKVGVDVNIAEGSFLIILAGVMLAFALAVGIGFGLALKDEARSRITQWKKKF